MPKLVVLLLVLAALPASASVPPCTGLGPSKVVVSPVWADPRYAHEKSIAQLTGTHRPGGSHRTLGLTTTNQVVRLDFSYRYQKSPSGQACVSPDLKVTAGYDSMRVDVAREFPRGSCAYREVLAHEDHHVAIYREHLARVIPEIRKALTAQYAGGPYLASESELKAHFEEAKNAWAKHIAARLAEANPLQHNFDSDAEYTRLGQSCGGEVNRLASAAR